MTLRRTASGLASLHLFFRADVVVYCEGGTSIAACAVERGAGDEATLDALFWRRVADFLGAKRKYHFKSVGSKSTLISIARDVQRDGLSTIIICLDRDYDWHRNCKIEWAHVVYTHGYSWESDTISKYGFEKIFFRMIARTQTSEQAFQRGLEKLNEFGCALTKWCETELALTNKGNKGAIFPRTKPLGMVDMDVNPPVLNETRLKRRLTELGYKRRPRVFVRVPETECLRHAWGHMVANYFYQLAMKLINSQSPGIRMSYDVFMRMLVADTIDGMRSGALNELAGYYKTMDRVFV